MTETGDKNIDSIKVTIIFLYHLYFWERWISSFLQDRQQRVVVGGEHSQWVKVQSGVPQGTVLGPLLFLIYINELPDNISAIVCLFADDCVLYSNIRSQLDATKLQKALENLSQWVAEWQMNFNPQKCYCFADCWF